MKALGYWYNENKRCYYTNGYEQDDDVKDQEDIFLIQHFEAELRSYCWVHIPSETAMLIEDYDTYFYSGCTYDYTDKTTGTKIREYHVDTHIKLCGYTNAGNRKYGGNLSVQRKLGTRPINDGRTR